MIRGNVKLNSAIEPVYPNAGVAQAIAEAGRRTDESNRALIDAVKDIMMTPPQVQVAAPQVKVQMPNKVSSWTFTIGYQEIDGFQRPVTITAIDKQRAERLAIMQADDDAVIMAVVAAVTRDIL